MSSRPLPLALLAVLVCAGCASTHGRTGPVPGSEQHALNAGLREVSARAVRGGALDSYVVAPPDVIAVHVRDNADVSRTGLRVGPDGTVSLPLVGAVAAGGRTTAEIAYDLSTRLRRYIRDAHVTVTVERYRSKYVYVVGEVRRPGRYPFTGRDTVVAALAQAGFLTQRAAPNRIAVARGNGHDPEVYPVRLEDIVSSDDSRTNWLLEPGDIVHVPPTLLARIGYTLDGLLFPFKLTSAAPPSHATYDGASVARD